MKSAKPKTKPKKKPSSKGTATTSKKTTSDSPLSPPSPKSPGGRRGSIERRFERQEGVKVSVRLRGLGEGNRVLGIDGTTLRLPAYGGLPERDLTVDRCFTPEVETSAVHKEIAASLMPLIIKGYDQNLLLIDTMSRPEQTASLLTRLCLNVFQHLIEDSDYFRMTLSMYELSGNRVNDLFVSTPSLGLEPAPFEVARVRWSPIHGPWVVGALKRDISSATDCAHAIAGASIRASKSGPHQTVFKMEITKTSFSSALTHTQPMEDVNDRFSTITVMDMGSPSTKNELSTTLNALGKIISGLTGGSQHISFKLGPGDVAQIYRETPACHLLGEAFNGNACTSVLATMSQAAKDLEETSVLLQLLERARSVTNRVWPCSVNRTLKLSSQRAELCKLSASDDLEMSQANYEASELLSNQLRELEKRQAELDNFEKDISQTVELKQQAEFEKLQKERTQAEKRRVEDNAKMLVTAATKGQQQAVDQYAVSEIKNTQLLADNRELEKMVEQYSSELAEKGAGIEALKQANEKLEREKGIEEERAEAARRCSEQDRKALLMDVGQLQRELKSAQGAAEQHKQMSEGFRNEMEHMKLDKRMRAEDIEMDRAEARDEVKALQQDVARLEKEKRGRDVKHAEVVRALQGRNEALADEMERILVDAKGREMQIRNRMNNLEVEKEELRVLLQKEESNGVRELGKMQEKKDELEEELEKVKLEGKDARAEVAAYKAEVEAHWVMEREVLISSVEEGCGIMSEFIRTIPELEGSLDTMTAWLADLNLDKYLHLLQAYGIKDMRGISMLSEEALGTMQISGVARRRLLEAAEQVIPQERDKTIATSLYSWMDMLHYRLTGEPAPTTPIQEESSPRRTARAPKKSGPAFHQVKQHSGMWASPQRVSHGRKYASKNEVHLHLNSGDSRRGSRGK